MKHTTLDPDTVAHLSQHLAYIEAFELLHHAHNRVGVWLHTASGCETEFQNAMRAWQTNTKHLRMQAQNTISTHRGQASTAGAAALVALDQQLHSQKALVHQWLQDGTPTVHKLGLISGQWLPPQSIRLQWHLHPWAAPELAAQRDLILPVHLHGVRATHGNPSPTSHSQRVDWGVSALQSGSAHNPLLPNIRTDWLRITCQLHPIFESLMTCLSHVQMHSQEGNGSRSITLALA